MKIRRFPDPGDIFSISILETQENYKTQNTTIAARHFGIELLLGHDKAGWRNWNWGPGTVELGNWGRTTVGPGILEL